MEGIYFNIYMKEFLLHLFIPRESNNHRSRVLHHNILLSLFLFLLALQLVVPAVKASYPAVLGVSINVSSEQLLLLTNQKRQEDGLGSLQFNEELSKAALLKARDMFEKNYWAHNAPDGTTPWFFFKKAGYDYVYAGENLARGFTDSKSIVEAWMASPSHRENMLSGNYSEVGFGVMEGKLLGEQTVLVVELLGNKTTIATPKTENNLNKTFSRSNNSSGQEEVLNQNLEIPSVKNQPLIDTRSTFWIVSLFIITLFISILLLDMIIIERKKIIRLVGHNIDHIFFFTTILILIIILGKGLII